MQNLITNKQQMLIFSMHSTKMTLTKKANIFFLYKVRLLSYEACPIRPKPAGRKPEAALLTVLCASTHLTAPVFFFFHKFKHEKGSIMC